MSRPLTLSTAVVAGLIAALSACGGSSTAPEPGRGAAPSAPLLAPLRITAEPASGRVASGGWVDVTVRVVNQADTAITVVGSGTCGVRLEVRDQEGQLVGQSRNQNCTRDCRTYVFGPREAVTRPTRFGARYWDNAAQRETSLPAGVYGLTGRVDGTLGECGGTPVSAAGAVTDVRVE